MRLQIPIKAGKGTISDFSSPSDPMENYEKMLVPPGTHNFPIMSPTPSFPCISKFLKNPLAIKQIIIQQKANRDSIKSSGLT